MHYLALWRYRPWHPTVPPLDVGLFALVQPVILLPVVFLILHRWPPAAVREPGSSR